MTMRVKMLQTRTGGAGSLLVAGSTYRVSEELGADLVGKHFAEDVDGVFGAASSGSQAASIDPVTKHLIQPYGGGGAVMFRAGGEVVASAPTVTGRIDSTVVVYGANMDGLCHAVRHRRKYGRRVVIIHPTTQLGGMTAGGLSYTDVKEVDQLRYGVEMQEFYDRCAAEYGMTRAQFWSTWYYAVEPKIADKVIRDMLNEAGVLLITGWYPSSVVAKTGTKPGAVEFKAVNGVDLPFTAYASYWFDGSDEGDLLALPGFGVTFAIGREATATYNESYAGIQVGSSLSVSVSAYKTPGDAGSGLLNKFMLAAPPGSVGAASTAIQASNYRVIVTNVASNRIPWPEPSNYDPMWYEHIGRFITAKGTTNLTLADCFYATNIPGGKMDWNNLDSTLFQSTDCIGGNANYLTADWPTRFAIAEDHKQWFLGFIKWLRTDPRVTGPIKATLEEYGLCRDEFVDNGGFSNLMYVRVGRRIVGAYVHKQSDVMGTGTLKHGLVFANYGADSHFCTLYADASGNLKKEGQYYYNPPFRHVVQYASLLPVAAECTNLMVGGLTLSASAVGISSLRMEPQRGWIGQVAADAMHYAITNNLANLQDVPLAPLQGLSGLTSGGIVLSVACPAENGVVDIQPNVAAWTRASSLSGGTANDFYGHYYYSSGGVGGNNVNKFVDFAPNIETTGQYRVLINCPRNAAGLGRATNVGVDITHAGGTAALTLNQATADEWHDMGVYTINAGAPSVHKTRVKTTGSNNNVIVCAVQYVRVS
mgnify:CR=1 FL=1